MPEKSKDQSKSKEKLKSEPPELDVRAQLQIYADSVEEQNRNGKEKQEG